MPRISLTPRSPLLIRCGLCIALLAATAAVACGGDDGDEPEPPAPPAAAEPSAEEPEDTAADAEDEPARAEPQQRAVAAEQADEQAEEPVAQAEEEADEPAVAQAEEQAAEQAADQAEEQAEEQAAEQAAEEAAEEPEEVAEEVEEEVEEDVEPAEDAEEVEEAVEEATPDDATEDETADDGKDIDDIEDGESLITGPLVEYAPVEDVRFEAVIKLDIAPNAAGDDAEFLALFSDISVEGVYLASGDHEISIRLGESSFLPPMGIVSIGDTLYTNLGFGWESSQGSTGGLVEGLGADLLGLDLGGLDLEGLLTGGDIGVLLSVLPYEAWEERGAEDLDSGPARIYTLQTDSLAGLFESLGEGFLGPLLGGDGEAGAAGIMIGAAMLAEVAALDSLEITLWIDEATGAAARLALAIDGLTLKEIGGPGADLSVGALALQLDASPHFGLLTTLRLAVEGLDIPGPEGMSGSVAITLDVTEINAGDVVIEPPA